MHHPAPATSIAATAGLDLPTTERYLQTLATLTLITQTPTGWRLAPSIPDPSSPSG